MDWHEIEEALADHLDLGTSLSEVGWTDEARAAALAARQAKAKGQDWRKAARKQWAKGRIAKGYGDRLATGAPETGQDIATGDAARFVSRVHAADRRLADRRGMKGVKKSGGAYQIRKYQRQYDAAEQARWDRRRARFAESWAAIEGVLADHLELGVDLSEVGWTDEARAASAAARKAKAKGQDWRKAGRQAMYDALKRKGDDLAGSAKAGDTISGDRETVRKLYWDNKARIANKAGKIAGDGRFGRGGREARPVERRLEKKDAKRRAARFAGVTESWAAGPSDKRRA